MSWCIATGVLNGNVSSWSLPYGTTISGIWPVSGEGLKTSVSMIPVDGEVDDGFFCVIAYIEFMHVHVVYGSKEASISHLCMCVYCHMTVIRSRKVEP